LGAVALTHVAYEAEGWGVGELWLDGDRLVESSHPNGVRHVSDTCQTPHPLGERFRAYFAGERITFDDVELADDWCTPFQAAVLAVLRALPYGELVTYGELAALAGHPNAQRAAGTFCARNRYALVVPCHRVVGADGLGSYGSLGLAYKRRLLALEGAL
jgi:methylated-DNA-[protein]-cysteine S-methyltransferase